VYSNPYYVAVEGQPVIVDYSQPVIVQGGAEAEQEVSSAGQEAFERAREAFSAGNYKQAIEEINQAIAEIPSDPDLHYFRAQALFADGQFEQAAIATHATMATTPGWSWETLSALYPDSDVYTQQLRALETYVEQNSTSAAAHFLLAYHYLMLGATEDAAAVLARVVELQPKDELSAEMLKALTGQEQPEPSAGAPEQSPTSAAASTVDAKAVGTWKANRDDGTSFELALQADGSFSWSFTRAGRTQGFDGRWGLEDDVLMLDLDDGAAMIARLRWDGEDRFKFELIDGEPDDPGLDFSKSR
jgi:tetratricopeptide (TPR) repeat protein